MINPVRAEEIILSPEDVLALACRPDWLSLQTGGGADQGPATVSLTRVLQPMYKLPFSSRAGCWARYNVIVGFA